MAYAGGRILRTSRLRSVKVCFAWRCLIQNRFHLEAHKTGTGSTKNGRDSNPKFLGIKKTHNSFAFVGNIIVRQRGAKFKCGIGMFQLIPRCVTMYHYVIHC